MMDLDVRFFFYDLFFSMFVREPSDEIINSWRKGLTILSDAQPDSGVGKTASKLLDYLSKDDANEKVRAEFFQLFWHPVEPTISLLASKYVDGRPFGKYLVRLRTFLEKTPFEKSHEYTDPEDSLPFHLDLMRTFIKEERETSCPEARAKWRALEGELFNDYLSGWIDHLLSEIAGREDAPFYREAIRLLRLFLQEEREGLLGL